MSKKSMADIINLLPDAVANQIAAGEVIQRPASAVKEMLENAVDAEATKIQLIVIGAGKTLIQVIDNGKGMTENDARMCFERHATSKIKTADDLFSIRTNGFRGEAMASIAAIAQVEMKTRTAENELGIQINIDGSVIKNQEACQTAVGTRISVKNLFFNVPARRNFLKSERVEMRHIVDEFTRVALANTQLEISLYDGDEEIFHLHPANLRQRIVDLFGKSYNEKLVPIAEETTISNINGFIGKPEFARKTRGEQFFFVNNRFIRSNYLNHAISKAFDEVLPEKTFPSYFIFFEVDPQSIDINIHPTKTEIKFEDEKSMYAILRSSVRQSLGKYNISPTLDFNQEMSISFDAPPKNIEMFQPEPLVHRRQSISNTAHSEAMRNTRAQHWNNENNGDDQWQKLYEGLNHEEAAKTATQTEMEQEESVGKRPIQIHGKYILSSLRSGTVIIDQKRAHQRIIYEQIVRNLAHNQAPVQSQLFPVSLAFSSADTTLLNGLLADINLMGIKLEPFGKNTFVVQGTAAYIRPEDVKDIIDEILEQHSQSGNAKTVKNQEKMAHAMARKAAIPYGKVLHANEMSNLIDELFGCNQPYTTPSGKPTLITLSLEELEKRFG
ncbi:DNA mismatch repair endonuclease MutL [Bacteroidota bacterium]